MIHHISIAANHPQHVAHVLAELCQGQSAPFPAYAGSYLVLALDPQGTMIEVHPHGTELRPGQEDEISYVTHNPSASAYSAVHAAISVSTSEAQIRDIAAREGWRVMHCDRQGYFEVIELWIENQWLLELLPPDLAPQYLAFMQPQSLQQFLAQSNS